VQVCEKGGGRIPAGEAGQANLKRARDAGIQGLPFSHSQWAGHTQEWPRLSSGRTPDCRPQGLSRHSTGFQRVLVCFNQPTEGILLFATKNQDKTLQRKM
jgi:hypothetical protein